MASATAKPKQDMPPSGGYRSIPFARIPARQYFSGYTMFLGFAGMTAAACYVYWLTYKKIHRQAVEMRSSDLALQPFMYAERDRMFLKHLRRNREVEADLMKDVPGWDVGTLYGEPVFRSISDDDLAIPFPTFGEYYAHNSYKDFARRANLSLWA